MKIKLLSLCLLLTGLTFTNTYAQKQDDAIVRFYEKYMSDDRFSTVYFSGRMFRMFSGGNSEDEETKQLSEAASKINGLRMLSSEKVDGVKLYKEAIKNLNTKGFEELMVVRDGNEQFQFMIREEGEIIKELLMISGENQSFMLMSIIGDIDLKSISKMTEKMDIKGLDKLKENDK
jgi:hypothetical protein